MTTNVLTTNKVWVLPGGPVIVNGFPAWYGVEPWGQTFLASHDYENTIYGLKHDTTYRIVVQVTDLQGNAELATTLFTTVDDAPGNKAAPGPPCYFACIESGSIWAGDEWDEAEFEVHTNADVDDIVLRVSTAPISWVGGNPILPNGIAPQGVIETSTSLEGTLVGLEADTVYNVVAQATDSEGFSHYATGQFTSWSEAPQDVFIRVERVHVTQTGDLVGHGEMRFDYGFAGNVWDTWFHDLHGATRSTSATAPGWRSPRGQSSPTSS